MSLLSENATYSKADQNSDSGKGNHKYNGQMLTVPRVRFFAKIRIRMFNPKMHISFLY